MKAHVGVSLPEGVRPDQIFRTQFYQRLRKDGVESFIWVNATLCKDKYAQLIEDDP